MSPTLTYLAAREHINDLLREADQARRASEPRATRQRRPRVARASTSPTVSADAITLRLSRPTDDRALKELAQLDTAGPPHGPHLLAEVDGVLRVAISLTDGAVIADPFHRTTALIELLRARANPQPSQQRTLRRTPASLQRRLAGRHNRNWHTAS
jgi:hypothetical protein